MSAKEGEQALNHLTNFKTSFPKINLDKLEPETMEKLEQAFVEVIDICTNREDFSNLNG